MQIRTKTQTKNKNSSLCDSREQIAKTLILTIKQTNTQVEKQKKTNTKQENKKQRKNDKINANRKMRTNEGKS